MFREITQVGKHSVVYGAGQVLQRLVGFLLIPLYTTYFTTSDYGIQEILSNTSSLLTTLLGLGLISALYRSYFMYPDEERRRNVVKTALSVFGVFSASIGVVLILLSRPLSALLLPDASYAPLLTLTLSYIILANILAVPFAVLRARQQSLRFVLLSLLQFVVNIGSTVVLVAVAGRGVRGSLEGNLLGQVAVLLLFAPALLSAMRARFSRPDLKEMLTFGLPLVPAMLASLSLTVSDRFFLRSFSTFDEIGIYGLGYKIGMMVQVLIVTPFALVWGPAMWAVASKPYARQFYAKVLTYFGAVALYAALGLSVLSPEVVRLMSRREAYWRAWQVVPLVALSYVFYGLYYQLSVGINLEKKTKYMPFIVGAAAAVNLGLNYLLIPPWGMMGAAVSTVASYALLAVLAYVVSRNFYPITYEWGRLLVLVTVFGATYLLSLIVPSSSLGVALALKALLLLLCPLFLYAVGFFSPEELARGRQLLSAAWRKAGGRLHQIREHRSRK